MVLACKVRHCRIVLNSNLPSEVLQRESCRDNQYNLLGKQYRLLCKHDDLPCKFVQPHGEATRSGLLASILYWLLKKDAKWSAVLVICIVARLKSTLIAVPHPGDDKHEGLEQVVHLLCAHLASIDCISHRIRKVQVAAPLHSHTSSQTACILTASRACMSTLPQESSSGALLCRGRPFKGIGKLHERISYTEQFCNPQASAPIKRRPTARHAFAQLHFLPEISLKSMPLAEKHTAGTASSCQ